MSEPIPLFRLATADLLTLRAIVKYSDDQPRDDHGRWTSTGDSVSEAVGERRAAWDAVTKEIAAQGDGNCYQAAGTLMFNADRLGLADPRICQGAAVGQGAIKGVKFGHAWLEADGPQGRMAYDYASGNSARLPAEIYRMLGHISDVHEYTPKQAATEMVRTGHYGPWVEPPEGTEFT